MFSKGWRGEEKQPNERKGDSFTDEKSTTELPPFSLEPPQTHMHTGPHTHTTTQHPLPLPRSEAQTSGVTDAESRWAPSPERGNALIRTDLKTTTTPPSSLVFFLSLSLSILHSIAFHPTLNLPLASLLASSRIATPSSFPHSSFIFICHSLFIASFLFVCVIAWRWFVVCSCSL